MSLEMLKELGGFGAISIIALALMVGVWRLPDVLAKLDSILARILDHADASNETALEAARIMRQTTSEALASKAQTESRLAEMIARVETLERDLLLEREAREALAKQLADERGKSRAQVDEMVMQAAKIKLLEDAIVGKERTIIDLTKERNTLLERIEALEKAQSASSETKAA